MTADLPIRLLTPVRMAPISGRILEMGLTEKLKSLWRESKRWNPNYLGQPARKASDPLPRNTVLLWFVILGVALTIGVVWIWFSSG